MWHVYQFLIHINMAFLLRPWTLWKIGWVANAAGCRKNNKNASGRRAKVTVFNTDKRNAEKGIFVKKV